MTNTTLPQISQTLSDTATIPQFIASERAAGACSDDFKVHAADCAQLAIRYEDDVRIFPAHHALHQRSVEKSRALRASESLFSVAAAEELAAEKVRAAELDDALAEKRAAYYAANTPRGEQLPLVRVD